MAAAASRKTNGLPDATTKDVAPAPAPVAAPKHASDGLRPRRRPSKAFQMYSSKTLLDHYSHTLERIAQATDVRPIAPGLAKIAAAVTELAQIVDPVKDAERVETQKQNIVQGIAILSAALKDISIIPRVEVDTNILSEAGGMILESAGQLDARFGWHSHRAPKGDRREFLRRREENLDIHNAMINIGRAMINRARQVSTGMNAESCLEGTDVALGRLSHLLRDTPQTVPAPAPTHNA